MQAANAGVAGFQLPWSSFGKLQPGPVRLPRYVPQSGSPPQRRLHHLSFSAVYYLRHGHAGTDVTRSCHGHAMMESELQLLKLLNTA